MLKIQFLISANALSIFSTYQDLTLVKKLNFKSVLKIETWSTSFRGHIALSLNQC